MPSHSTAQLGQLKQALRSSVLSIVVPPCSQAWWFAPSLICITEVCVTFLQCVFLPCSTFYNLFESRQSFLRLPVVRLFSQDNGRGVRELLLIQSRSVITRNTIVLEVATKLSNIKVSLSAPVATTWKWDKQQTIWTIDCSDTLKYQL